MDKHAGIFLFLTLALWVPSDWPQFRGPNASGLSEDTGLPIAFGPEENVVWKTPVPMGNSSPIVAGDAVYLTGFEKERLFTIAIQKETGKVLWRQEAPRPRKEVIERPANGPASASPVSDGRNVFVFFQDYGLLAYGPGGRELWRMPLGPFNNPFGHGASPILAGDTLLMNIDQDTGSYLLAVEKNSGRVLWRKERPFAQRGYATPVLYRDPDGTLQAIVAGSYRLSGYDVRSGSEIWWVRRLPWQIKPTPVVAGNEIFFTTYAGESDPGAQEKLPPFEEVLAKLDLNKDGKLSKDEITDPNTKSRFEEYLDLDNSGFLEARDWEQYRERRLGENGLRAYRLGGKGDLTETHLMWKNARSLPNVPSPLVYRGVLYTLKEGEYSDFFRHAYRRGPQAGADRGGAGRLLCVADCGRREYLHRQRGRQGCRDPAGPQWQVLRTNDLGAGCKGTPAIADGRLFVRTYETLYCFAKKK